MPNGIVRSSVRPQKTQDVFDESARNWQADLGTRARAHNYGCLFRAH